MKKFTDYIAEKGSVQSEVLGQMWNAAKQAVGMGSQVKGLPANSDDMDNSATAAKQEIFAMSDKYAKLGDTALSKALQGVASNLYAQYAQQLGVQPNSSWTRGADGKIV